MNTLFILLLCLSVCGIAYADTKPVPKDDGSFTLVIKHPNGEILHEKTMPALPAGYKLQIYSPHKYNWSDELDWLMVIIFGAPETEWESARKAYDTMAHYEKRTNALNKHLFGRPQ